MLSARAEQRAGENLRATTDPMVLREFELMEAQLRQGTLNIDDVSSVDAPSADFFDFGDVGA